MCRFSFLNNSCQNIWFWWSLVHSNLKKFDIRLQSYPPHPYTMGAIYTEPSHANRCMHMHINHSHHMWITLIKKHIVHISDRTGHTDQSKDISYVQQSYYSIAITPTFIGRGHYKMMGGVRRSNSNVHLTVACLNLTRERKGHRKSETGRTEAQHTGNMQTYFEVKTSKIKVIASQSLKHCCFCSLCTLIICRGRILEQPLSTAMLFQSGCFTL